MTDALAAADRFAYFMECLCRALGDPRFGPLPAGPVLLAIWKRLRRIATRFAVLATHIRAGTLPSEAGSQKRRTARSSIPRTQRAADVASALNSAPSAAATQAPRLPNRLGWLIRMRPGLHCFGGLLRHLLNDQEFQTLLAASREMRKLIRSLCRMFGLPLIPVLREPRRPRARSLEAPSSESVNRTLKQRVVPRPKPVSTQLPPNQPLFNLPRYRLRPGYDPLIRVPRRKKPA